MFLANFDSAIFANGLSAPQHSTYFVIFEDGRERVTGPPGVAVKHKRRLLANYVPYVLEIGNLCGTSHGSIVKAEFWTHSPGWGCCKAGDPTRQTQSKLLAVTAPPFQKWSLFHHLVFPIQSLVDHHDIHTWMRLCLSFINTTVNAG